MKGKHHMLAVAAIFFVTGAIGVLSSLALLIFGRSPNIVSAISSAAYIVGAYYLLRGSRPAKVFLAAMAGLATLLEGVIGITLVAYGQMPMGLLVLLLALLTAYCLCMLQFSQAFNAEFDRRSEAYRLKKEKAARRFYEELEQGSNQK